MNNIKYMERNQKYNLESNIHLLSQGNETIKNPKKKVFNDYFRTIAEEIEKKNFFFQKNHLMKFSRLLIRAVSS